MLGAFIPKCDSDGNYEEVQTHGSSGHSWCVDKLTGEKIPGTEKKPGEGMPDCKAGNLLKCLSTKAGFIV